MNGSENGRLLRHSWAPPTHCTCAETVVCVGACACACACKREVDEEVSVGRADSTSVCVWTTCVKIIIIYFIQIRHTDDFPSKGTRLVIIMYV